MRKSGKICAKRELNGQKDAVQDIKKGKRNEAVKGDNDVKSKEQINC